MSTAEIQQLDGRALALLNQGRLVEALQLYEQICIADETNANAWLRRGAINSRLNRPDAAIDCCRQAVALRPDSAEIRMNLVNVLLQSGKWADAAEQSEKMVQMAPGSATTWFMLGRSRAENDQLEEAAAAYRKALQIKPDYAPASHGLGFTLHRLGQWTQSITHFRHALRLNPRMAQAHWGLGMSLQMLGNLQEALDHYRQAAELNPKHAAARLGIGIALSLMGKQDLAVASFREAINLQPNYVDAYIKLAATLMPLGQPEEAQRLVDKVLELEPDNVEAVSLAATIDQHKGDIDKSHQRLKPLIEAGVSEVNVALAYSAICSSIDKPDSAITLLEQQLEKEHGLSATGRRNVHFNLGKLYDKCRNYTQAFEHYQKGNALKQADFDPRLRDTQVDATIACFAPDLMTSLPRSGIQSDKLVFVVGMPRSGTSLIEQILASHPAVFGAGKLNYVIQMTGTLQATLGKAQAYPQCIPELTRQEIDRLAQGYMDRITELSPGA
ncbi:MAG: tetratricopeptide repeat protein, partial [Thiogranum sp.]